MFDFAFRRISTRGRRAPTAEEGAELTAFRQMVDGMPVNVMTLNLADFTIDFVNRTSMETLRRLEHLLPCKADELLGQCVDIFHKTPERQRSIIGDARNLPFQTNIRLGDEVLDLLVTPIFGADGEYVKPMLTWSVITEKVRADAETGRLLQMLDEMPINVMTLNVEDFTINYVNRTSISTLKNLEHLLPCKADELLGQCFDIFHKVPAHQRAILADPANLPHRAKIRLGDEVLDLRVSAIRDGDGNYMGAMLNWSVVTEQVRLADTFENSVMGVVERVSASASGLQGSAQAMSSTAEETSRQATAVAAAAEQASANVQTVATAAEELASSIDEIGRQVAQSTAIAQKAVEVAKATDARVQGLAEAASKIGEVVNLINDIASQTNLLALNATIEAARAGDAGKGFAVVASEVKSLANQTARATEEIGAQIASIQNATGEAVQAIKDIGATIGDISEIATAIASAVEEQGAATREIAGNVQQASSGTREVTDNISGVTKAAGETGEAAHQVADAASALSEQSNTLRTQVEAFLRAVRAL
jgi:methyl-accepting chemotaxis protein